MIRVVLDTNLVISGMLWSGAPRDVLRIVSAQHAQNIANEALIDELRDVLSRVKFQKHLERIQKKPEELVTAYLSYTLVLEPTTISETILRDPKDQKVLGAAVGGNANYIISGDDDLLVLGKYDDIIILTARTFLDQFKPDKSS